MGLELQYIDYIADCVTTQLGDFRHKNLLELGNQKLERRLGLIKTAVALCPMAGLLGTVTGMIEVFDVMAGGSGNARGMAAGVSKATLPTMAGMVAAISGMLFSIQLERRAQSESDGVESNLELQLG